MNVRRRGVSIPTAARSKRRSAAFSILRTFAIAFALLIALVAWWWAHPPDPASEVRARYRPLVALERVPAPELGRGFERWRMIAAGPDTVTGLWRSAATPASEWAVVILGGIGTDDRAALLVPDSLPVGVLAISWPWKGSRRMSRGNFLLSVPALRAALLRTPGAIARGVEAVRRADPGSRVAMLGASLGVPPTVAALPLAHPEALVLVDGAADLSRMLRSETARVLHGGPASAALAPAAGALGARLLSALEPSGYGAASPGTAVLIVDAAHDERYPSVCVARLHATFPHATIATHEGEHMRPENRAQIAAIVETAWRWLETLPAAGAPAPAAR